MRSSKQGVAFRVAGYIFSVPGIMVLFLGIAMCLTYTNAQELSAGIGLSFLSLGAIIPGAAFLFAGFSRSREEEKIELIVTALLANGRITVESLAEKIGMRDSVVRRLLLKALAKNKVSGFFDKTSGEFVTDQSSSRELYIDKCPACTAPLERTYHKGEHVRCPACNTRIQ